MIIFLWQPSPQHCYDSDLFIIISLITCNIYVCIVPQMFRLCGNRLRDISHILQLFATAVHTVWHQSRTNSWDHSRKFCFQKKSKLFPSHVVYGIDLYICSFQTVNSLH